MSEKRTRGSPKQAPKPGKPVRIERMIFLCAREDGSTYYRLDFRSANRRRVREVAGETLSDARRIRTQREHEVNSGTYVHPKDRKRMDVNARALAIAQIGPTFEEFADRFEREYGSQRRTEYYSIALRPLRRYFATKRIREIRPGDLDRYRVHSSEVDGVAPATVRKRLTILGTMFRHGVRWGVLDVNPAADLEKPSEPMHKTRYLSREEFARLHEHSEPWLRPILTVAVLTGARLKEVAGLQWENVDRDGEVLFVSEDNKTGKPRGVPISEPVRKILDEAPGGRFKRAGFVFVSPKGESYTSRRERNRISQRTKAAAKAADLPGVTFHVLRHTAGSWLAQAGHSEVQIAALLGHATTATTKRYMHISPSHLRSATAALAAVLNGHAEDTKPTQAPSHLEAEAAMLRDSNVSGR